MAAADIGWKRFLYQEIFLQNLLCSDHETDMESDFENSPAEQLVQSQPDTRLLTIENNFSKMWLKIICFIPRQQRIMKVLSFLKTESKMLLKTFLNPDFGLAEIQSRLSEWCNAKFLPCPYFFHLVKKITTNYFLNLGAKSKINKHSLVIKSNMMFSARTLLLCLMKQKVKTQQYF